MQHVYLPVPLHAIKSEMVRSQAILSPVEPEQNALLSVLTENYHRSNAALHSHLTINGARAKNE